MMIADQICNSQPGPCLNIKTVFPSYEDSHVNSLTPGKFEWNFRHVIFKQILVIDGWGISCEIAQIWMSLDFTDDQWTLVQVMAWCNQTTSHYLRQCWPRSLSPYGVIGQDELKIRQSCDRLIFYIVNPILVRRHLYIETLPSTSATRHWNLSSWTTRTNVSYIVNTMAADGLATQVARPSAAMVLTKFSLNMSTSTPDGLSMDKYIHNNTYLTNFNVYNIPLYDTSHYQFSKVSPHISGLVQERRNSIANALELRLSCTYPSI